MLKIPLDLWNKMNHDLRLRGNGERESGAFLLGAADKISSYVCFDDLDPSALESGAIVFRKSGFIHLWNLCTERKVKVYADVHTHPTAWTDQSSIDKANPMIDQKKHIAIILPNYALSDHKSLDQVGIHEYLGKLKWKKIPFKSKKVVLVK